MKEQRILYNKRYSLLFIALHMKNDSMVHFCVFQVGKSQSLCLCEPLATVAITMRKSWSLFRSV